MPIYEYECLKCGNCFELRRSMNDSDRDVLVALLADMIGEMNSRVTMQEQTIRDQQAAIQDQQMAIGELLKRVEVLKSERRVAFR